MGSQQHDHAKMFHFYLQTNGVLLKYRSFYFTMQNIWGEVAWIRSETCIANCGDTQMATFHLTWHLEIQVENLLFIKLLLTSLEQKHWRKRQQWLNNEYTPHNSFVWCGHSFWARWCRYRQEQYCCINLCKHCNAFGTLGTNRLTARV